MSLKATSKLFLHIFFASVLAVASQSDGYPVFGVQYKVEGEVRLPESEIVEPFKAYYDLLLNRSRVDYYDGTVKTEHLPNVAQYGQLKFSIFISNNSVLNQRICFTMEAKKQVLIQSTIPSLEKYSLHGTEACPGTYEEHKGKTCQLWKKHAPSGLRTISFKFWTRTSDDVYVPVRYERRGQVPIILDYRHYQPGNFDDSQLDIGTDEVPCRDKRHYSYNDEYYAYNPMRDLVDGDEAHIDTAFEDFKSKHGKSYSSEEEHSARKVHFKNNFRYIQSKNRMGLSYTLGVNHMTDWTDDELKSLNGLKADPPKYNEEEVDDDGDDSAVPKMVDWRYYGAVTPVKNQAICGSCWSFGTTGTIEGSYFLKTGKLVRLSEQQLIDCSWGQGNGGCLGGFMFNAYIYLMKNGGLESDATYGRYRMADGRCHHNKSLSVVEVLSYKAVKNDTSSLMRAVYLKGPIAVAMDASLKSFRFYANGVYDDPQCGNIFQKLDHAVLVVGYGDIDGQPYWLVKNSWSTYWGDDGYFFISRKNNTCGLLLAPSYAIVK